jgi:uncharacterized protein (TIGR00369 family)
MSEPRSPATELSSVLSRVREHNDYNLLLDVVPYARFLGLRALSVGEQVRVHLPFRPGLVGNPMLPALHGGVVGACLEMAALLQVLRQRGVSQVPKTVDFTVDYLRAAKPIDLFAEAEVQRLGRRIVNVRMRAFQSEPDAPIALARGNFLVD